MSSTMPVVTSCNTIDSIWILICYSFLAYYSCIILCFH